MTQRPAENSNNIKYPSRYLGSPNFNIAKEDALILVNYVVRSSEHGTKEGLELFHFTYIDSLIGIDKYDWSFYPDL